MLDTFKDLCWRTRVQIWLSMTCVVLLHSQWPSTSRSLDGHFRFGKCVIKIRGAPCHEVEKVYDGFTAIYIDWTSSWSRFHSI